MKRRELVGWTRSAAGVVATPASVVILDETGLSDWDRVRPSVDQKVVGDVGEMGAAVVLRSRVRWFWV